MLYILAEDSVSAMTYAAVGLGIPARAQSTESVCVTAVQHLPGRFQPDDVVRTTPGFWDAMNQDLMRARARDAWSTTVGNGFLTSLRNASFLAGTVRRRGGTVLPPYDSPQKMDRESVEAWLAEDD